MPRGNPFEVTPPSSLGRSRVLKNFRSYEYSDATLDALDSEAPTLKHQAQKGRMLGMTIVLSAIMLLLIGRSLWLQVVRGVTYRDAAENNRVRIVTTTAPRGIIYDRNNTPLVENIAEFSVQITPTALPRDKSNKAVEEQAIANILQMSVQDIQTAISKYNASTGSVTLKEHVAYNDALRLRILLQDYPSVSVYATARRH